MKKILLTIAALAVVAMAITAENDKQIIRIRSYQAGTYREARIALDESKFYKGRNKVQGVVLHHTACKTIEKSLCVLAAAGNPQKSCHVVIDCNGMRYILADPERITKHAGYSYMNGREKVSEFTIGIEFQSVDTHVQPLTDEQIESAIDYLLPIIKKYRIPLNNIVTHEQVRTAWLKRYPDRAKKEDVKPKVDISQADYQRFMAALKKRLSR